MAFNSITFLFAFLPVVAALYFVAPGRFVRNAILLLASVVFYAYGGLGALGILAVSIALNYLAGLAMDPLRRRGSSAKPVLVAGIIANVALLGSFKYLGFFATTVKGVTGLSLTVPSLVMPIGVSFFTFEGLSYLIDVYRGKAHAERNPLDVALYMGLFATIMAGPIVRFEDFQPQIRGRRETLEDVADGIRRFVIGLAKKVIIAGGLGTLATSAFATAPAHLSVASAWIGALAFTGQIYFDFSGYSDMAIGVGRMLGFRLPENFDYPYISRSVTEFWRRWHMSLGRWFREYIYIPLGGNRVSTLVNLRNILVVWALTGLWHGATWSFVVWGVYYGALQAVEKFIIGERLERVPSAVRHAATMLAVVVGWVIFKSSTLGGAVSYLGAMVGLGGRTLVDARALYYLGQYKFELIVGVLGCLPFVPFVRDRLKRFATGAALRAAGVAGSVAVYGALFAVSISYVLSTTFTPFLYFKF